MLSKIFRVHLLKNNKFWPWKLVFVIGVFICLPSYSRFFCENSFLFKDQKYCIEIEWQKPSLKKNNEFIIIDEKSSGPYLIFNQTPQSRWVYSNLKVSILNSNRVKIDPLILDSSFNLFVFMEMLDGQGHSDDLQFIWNSQTQSYELNNLPLHEMEGCWTLRASLSDSKRVKESFLITKLTNFLNIRPDKKVELINLCEMCRAEEENLGHPHH